MWEDRGPEGVLETREKYQMLLLLNFLISTLFFSGLRDDNVLSPNVGRSKAPI